MKSGLLNSNSYLATFLTASYVLISFTNVFYLKVRESFHLRIDLHGENHKTQPNKMLG